MKKTLPVILALLLAGCAALPQNNPEIPAESISSAPQSAAVQPSYSEPQPQKPAKPEFAEPQADFAVLVEVEYNGGWAVIYEQAMPDEFNRKFSRDDVFYGLYAQVFDNGGKLINTIDFDRHNSNRINLPVYRVEVNGDVISFENWHQSYNSSGMSADRFLLAMTDEAVKKIDPYQDGQRYRGLYYDEIAAEGDLSLQLGSRYDPKQGRDLAVFRLVDKNGGEAVIMPDPVDASLMGGIYGIIYGEENSDPYKVSVDIDAATSQVAIKSEKILLELDFAKCVWNEKRSYTEQMLEKAVAVSPDNTGSVWAACSIERFESPAICDYVLKNKNGELRYLFSGSQLDRIEYIDDERILANRFSAVEIYDSVTGALNEKQLDFSLGSRPNPYDKEMSEGLERIALGTAVDKDNRLILIAHREYTFGSGMIKGENGAVTHMLPVTLTLLNFDGEHLRDIETGLEVSAFTKISLNTVDISCRGKSAVIASLQGEKATVQLM